ncbi:hypothetical protein SBA4_180014 [Candidatus Sulfopaludibacter sp. SbA4]|nr:hypothetical protein SBA4_180014 [Candidatus Sulfopaludibacter sp. SbA4]
MGNGGLRLWPATLHSLESLFQPFEADGSPTPDVRQFRYCGSYCRFPCALPCGTIYPNNQE